METGKMDLKTFVAESLVQITKGILEAQEVTSETGALINPPLFFDSSLPGIPRVWYEHRVTQAAQDVTFDVAVTLSSENSVDGGGKLSVAAFSLKAGGSTESKDMKVSRICFTVPVCWPVADC